MKYFAKQTKNWKSFSVHLLYSARLFKNVPKELNVIFNVIAFKVQCVSVNKWFYRKRKIFYENWFESMRYHFYESSSCGYSIDSEILYFNINFLYSICSFCVFCNNIYKQIRSCGREMNRKMLSKMCLKDFRCSLTFAHHTNKNCLILIISTQVILDLRETVHH